MTFIALFIQFELEIWKKTLEINKKGTFSEFYFLNSTILNHNKKKKP